MAVPKKKTSKGKQGQRRSHHGLKQVNVIVDKETGVNRLAHHVCKKYGTYNGKQVVTIKHEEDNDNDES